MRAASVGLPRLDAGGMTPMCDERQSARQGRRENPQRRRATEYWLVVLVLGATLSLPGTVRPQGPDGDPVERLRRALEMDYPDAATRDRSIKQCLAGLR